MAAQHIRRFRQGKHCFAGGHTHAFSPFIPLLSPWILPIGTIDNFCQLYFFLERFVQLFL
jgi:hypothetical protein